MAGTGVRALGRDLAVTDLVWSSRSGYPSAPAYRDFHAVDDASGLHLRAVADPAAAQKRWYEPGPATEQVRRDAGAFVRAVRDRLLGVRAERGAPGAVVVAWDTELFGHWWHEGPAFLEAVLRRLPGAGVRLATLATVLDEGLVDGEVELADGSWGAGKDWSVWAGERARPLADEAFWVQRRLLDLLRGGVDLATGRRPDLDQLVRQALLALSSDWAFMVTRDQAAAYARARAARHRVDFHRLAAMVEAGGPRRRRQGRAPAGARRPVPVAGRTAARAALGGGWCAVRVLHVSWEYPPVVYGGLGDLLATLAPAQVLQGHQVGVLALGHDVTPVPSSAGPHPRRPTACGC